MRTPPRSQHRPLDGMIVGTQKGGTTSLLRYLSASADVRTHAELEFPFFAQDRYYQAGFEAAADRWLEPGAGFRLAKNVGVMFLPWARERLRAHRPDCRIVVCLREPVARAESAYWFLRQRGEERLSTFDEALAAEEGRLGDLARNHSLAYVARGQYADQVVELIRLFGSERVLLVASEDLCHDPVAEVARVAAFLGVGPPPDLPVVVDRRHNVSAGVRSAAMARLVNGHGDGPVLRRLRSSVSTRTPLGRGLKTMANRANRDAAFERPPLSPATRQMLEERFAASNRRLADEFGFEPEAWQNAHE